MTKMFVMVVLLVSFIVMAIAILIARRRGFQANVVGVLSMIFMVIPLALGIGGINRLSELSTYGVLAVAFIMGLVLIKPGFRKIKK